MTNPCRGKAGKGKNGTTSILQKPYQKNSYFGVVFKVLTGTMGTVSDTTIIGKAVVGTIGGQYNVVQHLNIEKLGGVLYLFGDALVVGTWF